MHHAQYRFQTFTRIWYFTSNSGISKVDCKVDLLTGLLQPLFQEQVDLHTGPTSTSVSGTKLICSLGLLQPLFQEQSWSAHWAYYTYKTYRSGGIAQRVDHPTGKPGAILMCRFESQVWQGTFLPEPASSADSLMVSAQPPCAIACINICAHVKNLKHWQPYHCLDRQKYCTHGSTAR